MAANEPYDIIIRGFIAGEKFDRILVSATADEFPSELTEHLKVDGKLEGVEHYGFTFVPLIF